jgi:ketosteroid isomerase-like protein
VLARAEVKWAVYKAIDDLLAHIADGRHAESVAAFSEDSDAAIYGSETGEAFVGPRAIRSFFADLYARPYRVIFTLPERTVSASGTVAWFTGEGTYRLSTGGDEMPYRLSGVLERRRERWLWQLFSGSEPR